MAQIVSTLPKKRTTRIDDAGNGILYIGIAKIGSSEADPVWQIQKLTVTGAITEILFADGDEFFDNIWANRAEISYS